MNLRLRHQIQDRNDKWADCMTRRSNKTYGITTKTSGLTTELLATDEGIATLIAQTLSPPKIDEILSSIYAQANAVLHQYNLTANWRDKKIDDGLPGKGKLISLKGSTEHCTTTPATSPPGDGGATYDVSYSTKECTELYWHTAI